MNSSSFIPTHAGALRTLASLFSAGQHVNLAVAHNLSRVLTATDLAEKHKRGEYPSSKHVAHLRSTALSNFVAVRRSIAISGLLAAVICGAALAAAAALGRVHPSLPVDYGKAVTWVGAFLASWGAVLQFRPAEESMKGGMLHERLHGLVVRILFGSGTVLAAFGAVWWQ